MKYSMEKWRSIIAECHTSDLNQREFCQKKNLSYEAYRYWRKKFNRVDSSIFIRPGSTDMRKQANGLSIVVLN